jgi:Ca2+-binding RTX toxin-like protein
MATSIISTNGSTTGTNVTLGAGVNLLLLPGVYRVSSSGTAILAANATHDITLLGTVFGDLEGLRLGTSSSLNLNTDVVLGQGAELLSRVTGVESLGTSLSIYNEGLIKAGTAIDHAGDLLTLVNRGSIVGTGFNAVSTTGTGSITNYGTIQNITTGGFALKLESSGGATARVENFGTLAGAGAVFGDTIEADTVLNHGRISGDLFLNGGDDLYDGHGGTLSGIAQMGLGNDTAIGGAGRDVLYGGPGDDWLEGGEGDDRLRPGSGADHVDGGAGRDIVDYTSLFVPVTLNLAAGEASDGPGQYDILIGIEDAIGSDLGDTLAGDAGANRIWARDGADLVQGAAGNDVLFGEGGADTLAPGAGVDVLRGGAGADVFRFAAGDSGAPGQVRDRIVDFTQADGDRIDLFFIDANAALAGNQAFVFQPGAAFTGAGQVRAQVVGGSTLVLANTDATATTAEFSLLLSGVVPLTAADFVL